MPVVGSFGSVEMMQEPDQAIRLSVVEESLGLRCASSLVEGGLRNGDLAMIKIMRVPVLRCLGPGMERLEQVLDCLWSSSVRLHTLFPGSLWLSVDGICFAESGWR